ncbi:unnamed protein product [Amoebophrya sp. A25]|nr:unnamed protein product [Amoebophrya sp. A25]|eukprot:GSA25T00026612001.1
MSSMELGQPPGLDHDAGAFATEGPGSLQIGGSSSSSTVPPAVANSRNSHSKEHNNVSTSHNKEESNIVVAVRCRPCSSAEAAMPNNDIVKVLDNSFVVIQDPGQELQGDYLRLGKSREKRYCFDLAFGGEASTEEVYNKTARNLITSILKGYNGTVFAYGATGAGKTFTMIGTKEEPGIMFLILRDLFHLRASSTTSNSTAANASATANNNTTTTSISSTSSTTTGSGTNSAASAGGAAQNSASPSRVAVKCSFIEVYNENIRDLLIPSSSEQLELREDPVRGCHIAGVHEFPAQSVEEIMHLLHLGNRNRTTEGTAVNETSSRSHAVLQLTCEEDLGSGETAIGKLSLIDLAGSERASKALSDGQRLIEASNINRSLLALGNCINALVEKQRRAFVPYRDSKLTRLLKNSLGGNCRTCMIACVSPTAGHYEETSNTLKYANRTKNIKTTQTYRRNLISTTEETDAQVAEYVEIIGDLRKEIAVLKGNLEERNNLILRKECAIKAESESERWKSEMIANLEERVRLQRELMDTETVQSRALMAFETAAGEQQDQSAAKQASLLSEQDSTHQKSLSDLNVKRTALITALEQNRGKSQNLHARLRDIPDIDLRAFLELLYRAQVLEVERMELDHVYAMKQQVLDQKDQDLKNLRKQLDLRNEYLGRQQSYLSAEERELLPGHVSLLESTITSPTQWKGMTKPVEEEGAPGAIGMPPSVAGAVSAGGGGTMASGAGDSMLFGTGAAGGVSSASKPACKTKRYPSIAVEEYMKYNASDYYSNSPGNGSGLGDATSSGRPPPPFSPTSNADGTSTYLEHGAGGLLSSPSAGGAGGVDAGALSSTSELLRNVASLRSELSSQSPDARGEQNNTGAAIGGHLSSGAGATVPFSVGKASTCSSDALLSGTSPAAAPCIPSSEGGGSMATNDPAAETGVHSLGDNANPQGLISSVVSASGASAAMGAFPQQSSMVPSTTAPVADGCNADAMSFAPSPALGVPQPPAPQHVATTSSIVIVGEHEAASPPPLVASTSSPELIPHQGQRSSHASLHTLEHHIDWSSIEVPRAHKIKGVSQELAGLKIGTSSTGGPSSSIVANYRAPAGYRSSATGDQQQVVGAVGSTSSSHQPSSQHSGGVGVVHPVAPSIVAGGLQLAGSGIASSATSGVKKGATFAPVLSQFHEVTARAPQFGASSSTMNKGTRGSPKRPDTGPGCVNLAGHGRIHSSAGGPSRRPRPKTDYSGESKRSYCYAQRHQQREWREWQQRREDASRNARLNPPMRRAGVAFNSKIFASHQNQSSSTHQNQSNLVGNSLVQDSDPGQKATRLGMAGKMIMSGAGAAAPFRF